MYISREDYVAILLTQSDIYINLRTAQPKGKEESKMKTIELLEEMAARGARYSEEGINQTFGRAYFSTKKAENETIDFSDVIWENEIPEIVKNLERFEIREFTISSTYSSLIETLLEFEHHGFRMDGLTTVNKEYIDWETGELKKAPAIRMIAE